MPHGVPVLAHHQHPVLLVEREHADRAGVLHVLAAHGAGLAQVDRVAHDVPDQAVVHDLGRDDGSRRQLVADR